MFECNMNLTYCVAQFAEEHLAPEKFVRDGGVYVWKVGCHICLVAVVFLSHMSPHRRQELLVCWCDVWCAGACWCDVWCAGVVCSYVCV